MTGALRTYLRRRGLDVNRMTVHVLLHAGDCAVTMKIEHTIFEFHGFWRTIQA